MHNAGALFVAAIFLADRAVSQTGPTYCSYSDGVYECDYDKMVSPTDRPIYYSDFSVQPQQLILNVNGFLPYFGDARIFDSGFSTSSSMDVTQFDSNFPARLEVNCGWSGTAYIDTWAFSDMEYIQYFKIKNCNVFYINVDTVDAFQELDYFGIEGGTIDTIELLAMGGLTVEKLTSATHQFARLQGKFEILNSKFVYGVVNTGLLTFFTNVSSITLRNAGISYMYAELFKYNPYVTLIDISENLFTKLPNGFLDYQDMLSEFTVYDIDWECTCDNLWWVENCFNKNITVIGDKMCSNVQATSVLKYYYDNCASTDPCDGKTGFAIGDKCQSVLSVIIMCLSFIAVVVTSTSLALAIINMRNLEDMEDMDELDPVLLDRQKLKARQRWRKAARQIIYLRRKGRPLYGFASEGSKTMSIPDETQSHGRPHRFSTEDTPSRGRPYRFSTGDTLSNGRPRRLSYEETRTTGFYSFGNSSFGDSSIEDFDYADFPTQEDRGGQRGFKYS